MNFQVQPPSDWTPNSQKLPDDFRLEDVRSQKPKKLLFNVTNVSINESEEMPYKNFKETALKKDQQQVISKIEDVFWKSGVTKRRKYAINVATSLFGEDVLKWNLGKFTNAESTIHTTPSYRSVSKYTTAHTNFEKRKFFFSPKILPRSTRMFLQRNLMTYGMLGIQDPVLYIGEKNTSTGFHIEDGDLPSINFLHRGMPKVWYV